MATPLSSAPAPTGRSPRRRRLWIVLALVLVVLAALAFYGRPLLHKAELGAAYGARVGCSCRFVAGRPLHDCRKDFEAGMSLVMLSEDAEARRVTARVPLLARQSATFREGWGCQLEPWRD